ncbi:MAG: hypothetical protein R6W06_14715 [Prochlorococcaceae cyanobacterium]
MKAHLLALLLLVGGSIGGCRTKPSPTRGAEPVHLETLGAQACNDALYRTLQERLQAVLDNDIRTGDQRLSGLAWEGADYAEAALIAYQQFGDRRFLDMVSQHYDHVLQRRDDKLNRFDQHHNRIMKAWGSRNLDKKRWIAHITHNARIVHTGVLFARLIEQDPNLKAYQPKANHYLKEATRTLQEFEEDWHPVAGEPRLFWYQRPNDKGQEATNHLHMIGRTWIHLATLTGEARYKQRITMVLDAFLKGVNRHDDGTASWNYFPYFARNEQADSSRRNGQDYSEPIWKGALTAPFLLEAQTHGYAVPSWLIQGIGQGFAEHSFQGRNLLRNLSPQNSRMVDASQDRQKLSMLSHLFGLTTYNRVDSRITPKLHYLVQARPDLLPGGWLASAAGVRGYAIARCPKPTGAQPAM